MEQTTTSDLVDDLPVIPEEMRPNPVQWAAAQDNREPYPLHWAHGRATLYTAHNGKRALRLETGWGQESYKPFASTIAGEQTILLVDDGEFVRPFYSVGSHEGQPSPMYPEGHAPYMLFHEMSVHNEGMGPKQAFYVRLTGE